MKIKMSIIIMGLISASSICQANEQQHNIRDGEYYDINNKKYDEFIDGTEIIINKNSLATVQVNKYNNEVAEIFISPKDTNNISHNKYDSFRVDSNGIILNNNKANAEYIINEVVNNGKHSLLEGNIGVKGRAAHVIIANPNGIICDNCTFSNHLSSIFLSGTVRRPDKAVAIYFPTPLIPESHPAYDNFDPYRGKVEFINSKNTDNRAMFRQLNIISNGIKIYNKLSLSGDINIINNYTVVHHFDNSLTKHTSPIRGLKGVRFLPTYHYLLIGNEDHTNIISPHFNGNIHSDSAINIYAYNSQVKNYGYLDSKKTHFSLYNKTNFENYRELYINNLELNKDNNSTIKNMKSGTLNYALPYVFDSSATKEEIENNEINNKTETQLRKLLKDNNFINKGEINIYSLQRVN
ncbi:filamentous hemagglutinin N-terminal domain-containing protein [Proteus myxofaciens]|uniref:Hemolysin n=1 Tax=Proteus myxofaciens ATCC 19692 TaxID=1354337 RepID=A0A198FG96_9GAMM|nr:filamentous hemagglutinin N-terminal domain-containing protein [Proteus myxofaciens]OAT23261.1 hemolysin [Proteus myxofaciens ATCC 19692]